MHTKTRQTARGENGYKRLCEGAERRHHFFLHSAHTTKPKDLRRLASIFVFRRKQAFCGSGWSFDRSEPLSRIGASDGHPVVDTQTAGFLLIANVIWATVGVRLCDCSRILYACQRAETYSRCLNIPNVTYSRSCSIEVVVDSSRVPQYPFLLYFRIAKTAPPRSCSTRDAQCDHV